jgi:SAM-dependent MidA family methyltransferase
MVSYSRSWFDAWVESAYGPEGFWRLNRPEDHFRTAAATSPLLAERVVRLLNERPDIGRVVDVGAGSGQLLAGLQRRRPDLRLSGVDVHCRPDALPPAIQWAEDLWDVRYRRWTTGGAEAALGADGPVLVISCEWLDDLPCPVVVKHADGWREVVVDDAGNEQPGPRLTGAELAWADRWWPSGDRAEVGLPRDHAWHRLASVVVGRGGEALMIDYGHLAEQRPVLGSFAAYRDGRAVSPVPLSEVNLTAHVSVDAVRAAGEAAGLRTVSCDRQREVLADLAAHGEPPGETARDQLADLARRSQYAALGAERRWGSHWWLPHSA